MAYILILFCFASGSSKSNGTVSIEREAFEWRRCSFSKALQLTILIEIQQSVTVNL